MKLIRNSRELCEKQAVTYIGHTLRDLLKRQEHVVLGLCGGRSVAGIFGKLVEEKIEWEKVHIFLVDERLLPIIDRQTNFSLIQKELLQNIVIPKENVHPFLVEEGAEAYEKDFKKFGGKFDIILLSAGEDGHVAGLFPNHSITKKNSYFITMKDAPKQPPERMSASRSLLIQSQFAVLLFFGEGKRKAFEHFLDQEMVLKDCPAKLVQEIPDSLVCTDLKG